MCVCVRAKDLTFVELICTSKRPCFDFDLVLLCCVNCTSKRPCVLCECVRAKDLVLLSDLYEQKTLFC